MINACLVFFPLRLGDSVFLTPLLSVLRRNYPQAKIDVMTISELSYAVIQNNPYVNAIYHFPDDATLINLQSKYDFVLDLFQSAASLEYTKKLALPIKGPLNYDLPLAMTDLILDFAKNKLNCEILSSDRAYQLFPDKLAYKKIDNLFKNYRVTSDATLIGFHLGCHGLAKFSKWKIWATTRHPKVWPLKNFIKLAKLIKQKNPKIRFVLTGSSAEKRIIEKFKKKFPDAIDVIDQTSVLELAALMSKLALLISSDTGVLHVGSAMQIPIIAIFGPTDPNRTGPYPIQEKFKVFKADQIEKITADEIIIFASALGRFD